MPDMTESLSRKLSAPQLAFGVAFGPAAQVLNGPEWERSRSPKSIAAEVEMHDTPIDPMSAENVEEFDVLVFESRDLLVSVIPRRAPWKLEMENYEVTVQQ